MSDDDEFPPPKVTDAPAAIWLVYGEIEHDDTHRECCAGGEVTWCEDRQFDSDVQYLRADLAVERVRVLREASNALLHQIDIGDFVDSHGHSAKMLKAVHDLMRVLEATK